MLAGSSESWLRLPSCLAQTAGLGETLHSLEPQTTETLLKFTLQSQKASLKDQGYAADFCDLAPVPTMMLTAARGYQARGKSGLQNRRSARLLAVQKQKTRCIKLSSHSIFILYI